MAKLEDVKKNNQPSEIWKGPSLNGGRYVKAGEEPNRKSPTLAYQAIGSDKVHVIPDNIKKVLDSKK